MYLPCLSLLFWGFLVYLWYLEPWYLYKSGDILKNKVQEKCNNIIKQFNENINSHVFLIETNNKDKCLEDVKNIIKSVINSDEITSYQIDNESYIELSIIRNEGREIVTDQIKYLLEKLKTKPLLSKYLFYVILDSESLNAASSNKLLKTIEEPEEGIIGFLITSNLEKILPTVKSRCEIIKLDYESEFADFNEDILDVCIKLINKLETASLANFNIYKNNNKILEENYKEVIGTIIKIYNDALLNNKNAKIDNVLKLIKEKNTDYLLIKKSKYLNSIVPLNNSNMNKDLLLEKIYIDFKGMKQW